MKKKWQWKNFQKNGENKFWKNKKNKKNKELAYLYHLENFVYSFWTDSLESRSFSQ